jgi:hypothetical protein
VGLCRESSFTALASGATFAVTDDRLTRYFFLSTEKEAQLKK